LRFSVHACICSIPLHLAASCTMLRVANICRSICGDSAPASATVSTSEVAAAEQVSVSVHQGPLTPRAAPDTTHAQSPSWAVGSSPGSRYKRIEPRIGEGAYGTVHRAHDLVSGRSVAIKTFKVKADTFKLGGLDYRALREVKLMQALRGHPNIMSCFDVFSQDGALHLVMEFMDGDLRILIDDQSVVLSEAHVKCLTGQLLQGLAAIHRNFFVHRDLTASNILLSFSTGLAKITDFGTARTLGHKARESEGEERPLTPHNTMYWYRAPELLYGARFYGPGVDVWGVGCIFAELFLRKPLFPGKREFDMLDLILEMRGSPTDRTWLDVSALPNFWPSEHPPRQMSDVLPMVSETARNVLEGMLVLDPKQRLKADQALRSEFFSAAAPNACAPHELPFVRSGKEPLSHQSCESATLTQSSPSHRHQRRPGSLAAAMGA